MGLAGSVRVTARVLVAVTAATLAVACAHGEGAPTITVGAGDSAQSEVLAEIYAQALARAGTPTSVKKHLGQRADYLAALDAGTITLVADTSGDLLTTFDSSSSATAPDRATAASVAQHHDPGPPVDMTAGTPVTLEARYVGSVADDLSRAVPEGLAVSDLADATDLRPQFALGPAAAARYPANAADLAPHCGDLTVGIAGGRELDPLRTPPDPQRDVVTPLRTVYGCDITRHVEFPGDAELRKALRDGTVDAGVFTSAVPLLPGGPGDPAVVTDPAYAFRAQNVVPLLRQGALDQRQIKKLNYVAGELTTADLATMVRRVRDEHASAAELARTWLDEHAL
ncbi:glycine betaine ABC transporter substrate-binding protein [Nocardia africana]|uniref:Substrate binding domain of ABC-type glycine betaine transport system n=1 Tax=Nocardia africana TaxID=134964 RepID=A0A378X577_9NOCA|nr:glycine betaine ABC transporter substrate-binding protein [Nocardia africana]MCC3316956.1 transporter [Nocardia africana]SUA47683.1 Substrate binding domain of ABC-type glycine betaine transport system [Nocardia africana]